MRAGDGRTPEKLVQWILFLMQASGVKRQAGK
jgi:hypothetical protein